MSFIIQTYHKSNSSSSSSLRLSCYRPAALLDMTSLASTLLMFFSKLLGVIVLRNLSERLFRNVCHHIVNCSEAGLTINIQKIVKLNQENLMSNLYVKSRFAWSCSLLKGKLSSNILQTFLRIDFNDFWNSILKKR